MAHDTFKLTSDLVKGVQDVENAARRSDTKLYHEKKLTFSISPLYARYIGSTVTVAFNGNFRKFPVDGTSFELSRGHYNALVKYLRHIDRQIKIQSTAAKFMDTQAAGDFKRL